MSVPTPVKQDRCAFSPVHAGLIDEDCVRQTAVTYTVAARRFLPVPDGDRPPPPAPARARRSSCTKRAIGCTVPPVTTTVDGRAARSARTRDAVVDAFLELIDEGDLRPTARRVAERAGVSLRSVYVRFADLGALQVAAARRQWQRLSALAGPLPLEAPLDERIDALVEQRCRILEVAAPVRRAAELQEPFSPELAESLTWARGLARAQLAEVFAPELTARRGAARSRLLDGLDVATGATTWEVLRRHRELSPVAARRVVADMVTALVASPPTRDPAARKEP